MANIFHALEANPMSHRPCGIQNVKRPAVDRIRVVGTVDPLTVRMVHKYYDTLARNLSVYPSVTLYESSQPLEGDVAGLYYSEDHRIDIVDQEYIVSTLAHEMRHAFQAIYRKKEFYASSYRDVYGYIACWIERDARMYALDFCAAQRLNLEREALWESEQQYALVVQRKLSPQAAGLDPSYFKRNPKIAYTVEEEEVTERVEEQEWRQIVERDVWRKSATRSIQERVRTFVQTAIAVFVMYLVLTTLFGSNDASNVAHDTSPTHLLPMSQTERITSEQIESFTKEELRLARNEIYARHGYIFGTGDLTDYFSQFDWYEPNAQYGDHLLSELEHYNIAIIVKRENELP